MIDKEAFLKSSLPERTFDLDGDEVTVRGLSRAEVVALQALKADLAALERRILELGFVDPALDAGEVERWYTAAPAGHTDKVVAAITDLSGMTAAAPKSGVPGVRGEQRP